MNTTKPTDEPDVPATESVAGEEDPGASIDLAVPAGGAPVPAMPGAPCPRCGGTGRIGDQPCPECEGTGNVVRGAGGA